MEQILASGSSITIIHFSPSECIACMPNMKEFHKTRYHPAYHRTNEYRAVTCPQCKQTQLFKIAETTNSAKKK